MIQLSKQESMHNLDIVKSTQEAERINIEDNHTLEFDNMNSIWENRIRDQQDYANQEISTMISKHQAERVQDEAKLESTLPLKPKYSSELLNMIKIEEGLVKQKAYGEAHAVQQRIGMLMMRENENWEKERRRKINQSLIHLDKRHSVELNALKTRLRCAEDELCKSRVIELEKLLQKYHNIKKDLQNYQIQEINRISAIRTSIN